MFTMTPAGTLTAVHSFVGAPNGGATPRGALLLGADGNFYGTTANGGPYEQGVVFRLRSRSKRRSPRRPTARARST